jgi:hypothetical protein
MIGQGRGRVDYDERGLDIPATIPGQADEVIE